MDWPYKDTSEGPGDLEAAAGRSAARSKDEFLHDAGIAWDRMKNKEPFTKQGMERLTRSEEPRDI